MLSHSDFKHLKLAEILNEEINGKFNKMEEDSNKNDINDTEEMLINQMLENQSLDDLKNSIESLKKGNRELKTNLILEKIASSCLTKDIKMNHPNSSIYGNINNNFSFSNNNISNNFNNTVQNYISNDKNLRRNSINNSCRDNSLNKKLYKASNKSFVQKNNSNSNTCFNRGDSLISNQKR